MDREILTEAVLDIAQRRKRSLGLRKHAHRLKRGKELRKGRFADSGRLQKRSERAALRFIKKKFGGKQGQRYKELSPGAKAQIDRLIQDKKAPLKAIARRLLPGVRRGERDRLQRVRSK